MAKPVGPKVWKGWALNRVDAPSYDDWPGTLLGCHNDIMAVRDLLSASGWECRPPSFDQDCTAEAILQEIADLAGQAVPGGVTFLEYSGHGAQFRDVDGDEEDGYDESWITFKRPLTDDEIKQALAAFPAGHDLYLMSDSCNSRDISRAFSHLNLHPFEVMDRVIRVAPEYVLKPFGPMRAAKPPTKPGAKVMVWTAAQSWQSAFDGEGDHPMGAFTEAVVTAAKQLGDGASYNQVHATAVHALRGLQRPWLEGPTSLRKRAAFVR